MGFKTLLIHFTYFQSLKGVLITISAVTEKQTLKSALSSCFVKGHDQRFIPPKVCFPATVDEHS